MFPSVNLEPNDVISTWAGLRPLIHEDGKDPSELSRKDEVFYSKTGLVSIAGGKLTGYRKMAERIIDVVANQLKEELPNQYNDIKKCQTATLQLMGGQFESQEAVAKFIVQRGGEVSQIGLKEGHVIDLVEKYGTETDKIIEKAFELYRIIQDAEKRLHVAELWYVINYEMTNNLDDYLIRRSGRLYFERDTLAQWYPFIADEMGKILNWSESDKYRYLADFKNEYEEVVAFKKEMSLV
jgi:glycerol-3-phosphate dehydrogenase